VLTCAFLHIRLCLDDAKVWHHLNRRRNDILKGVIPSVFAPSGDAGSCVWVDAEELRRFFSCRELYRDCVIGLHALPLQYKRLLCTHPTPGLHPRVARKGKLLPTDVYCAFESLLRTELKSETFVSDCTITLSNVFCTECSEGYRLELYKKVDLASLRFD
jgi:hypothetical protein